jgi:imidazole glycerol-phosphate synthase subunit HisF
MLKTRVIPCLLLKGSGLVKTIRFKQPTYLGDPRNIVRIFNKKEVDELILLDIAATPEKRQPNFDLIAEIVSECFMPVCYGGGIRDLEDLRRLLAIGIEKIAINTYSVQEPEFIKKAAALSGSQSIVAAIDVKKNLRGRHEIYINHGQIKTALEPAAWAEKLQELGAGEIFLNSMDRDGTMKGYDLELIKKVTRAVDIPVIASGGAGQLSDLGKAVLEGGAAAVAAGSLFVFQGIHRAVLISYPEVSQLETLF